VLFSIDKTGGDITTLPAEAHTDLDILERDDLEEWIIREPALLEEDLLIISSEYAMFEDTRDRLDILALDPDGKLVVAELKRDRADRTTDLQAIKYASFS
jgi:RecB family endonuclease NucS